MIEKYGISKKWQEVTLIQTNYFEALGCAVAVVAHPLLGNFSGTARLHPEDKDFPNAIAGTDYAVSRAYISYLKAVKRNLRITKQELIQMEAAAKKRQKPAIKCKIDEIECEIDTIIKAISDLRTNLNTMIIERDKSVREFYRLKKQKEKRKERFSQRIEELKNIAKQKENK